MAPHSTNVQACPGGLKKKVRAVLITARSFVQGCVNGLHPVTHMTINSRKGVFGADVPDLSGARGKSGCRPLSSFCFFRNFAPFTGARIHSRAARGRLSFTLMSSLCHV
jgi:hypothetical protein